MRIDKWLWAARFFKTRRLAVEAIIKGQVCIAKQRVKPARQINIGEQINIKRGDMYFEVIVCQLLEQRGSATVAQTMYRETSESLLQRQLLQSQREIAPIPKPDHKPDKRERDQLRQVRRLFE